MHAHRDLTATLSNADPGDKADLYRGLGLSLVYDISKHEIRAEMCLGPDLA